MRINIRRGGNFQFYNFFLFVKRQDWQVHKPINNKIGLTLVCCNLACFKTWEAVILKPYMIVISLSQINLHLRIKVNCDLPKRC